MDQVPAHGMHLVVLEDRRVRGRLAVERDVEDCVEAVVAGEHAPELALVDAERMRLVPAPVEDAGNQPLTPHAPRVAGSPTLALAHGQLYSLAGHGGEV